MLKRTEAQVSSKVAIVDEVITQLESLEKQVKRQIAMQQEDISEVNKKTEKLSDQVNFMRSRKGRGVSRQDRNLQQSRQHDAETAVSGDKESSTVMMDLVMEPTYLQ